MRFPFLLRDKYIPQIQVAAGIKKLNKVPEIICIKCVCMLSFEECMKVELKARVFEFLFIRKNTLVHL